MELHFDFTENATRSQILDTILDAMTVVQRQRFGTFSEEITIPDHHHSNMEEIRHTIASLTVPQKIREDALGIYEILVEAEASVHGCSVEEAHFHEVGNSAGIRNVLAICTGIYVLAPERITATSVQVGKGKVQCAHGLLDVPTPATKVILDSGIPVCDNCLEGERCTPTSAAIIRYYVQEFV